MRKYILFLFFLTCGVNGFAQEQIVDFEKRSLSILNDELRKLRDGVDDTKSLTDDVTGILPVPSGGTGLSDATDDTVLVGNGVEYGQKTMPNCPDSTGNHLNYTQADNTFECGTSATFGKDWIFVTAVELTNTNNTGNIAIPTGQPIKVFFNYHNDAVAADSTVDFRFNSDSGTDYEDSRGTGQTAIRLHTQYRASSMAGEILIWHWVNSTSQGIIRFTGVGKNTGAAYENVDAFGHYKDSAIEDFELVFGQNGDFNVYVYKLTTN